MLEKYPTSHHHSGLSGMTKLTPVKNSIGTTQLILHPIEDRHTEVVLDRGKTQYSNPLRL